MHGDGAISGYNLACSILSRGAVKRRVPAFTPECKLTTFSKCVLFIIEVLRTLVFCVALINLGSGHIADVLPSPKKLPGVQSEWLSQWRHCDFSLALSSLYQCRENSVGGINFCDFRVFMLKDHRA